jgi:hypothetical protein
MNRNYSRDQTGIQKSKEITKKIAIHEAGHAAAIHLGNKKRGLPPVFFQIFITPLTSFNQPAELPYPESQNTAKVEGGRLIHTLPLSFEAAALEFSASEKLAFTQAFEADIINLLVGPLAEASYIALQDGEIINPYLVNMDALHYYGGSTDIETINQYLNCLTNQTLGIKPIKELFLAAFRFVNDRDNWRAINLLADYIVMGDKNIIDYDEIVSVLDASAARQTMPYPL